MNSWRDAILDEFVPSVSKLTLVADPDGLLSEEKLAVALRERGFDVIEFTDAVEFRFAYESRYRSIWDEGQNTDLVVILRLQNDELDSLPYDLLQTGRRLGFNLGALFPNLSYPVVGALDRNLLDELFAAQSNFPPDRMGDNATKDFILRHVFGFSAELIGNDVDLLRALLRLHYGQHQLPSSLAERLIAVLGSNACFQAWPLTDIVPDEEAFFAFLQERWPIFLSGLGHDQAVQEDPPKKKLAWAGPEHIPFDHPDIKVYIDNLFLEGKLRTVDGDGIELDAESWAHVGITTRSDDGGPRTARLFDLVENAIPDADARHSDWIGFALKWAELSSLVHCGNNPEHQARHRDMSAKVNEGFAAWLTDHYASLINLPPGQPAMLHHVPRHMARAIESPAGGRVALIVADGLALDQWVTIRQYLQEQESNLIMRESATFAWIPTITSVSRQAAFSGKAPMYFPSSINSTHKEDRLWKQFWEDHGLSRLDIAYQRGLGTGSAAEDLDARCNLSTSRAVGLVVDTPDKIMHGMELGAQGMHTQLKLWATRNYLLELIQTLLRHDFAVWLTADHGNIECEGKGRPKEGAIAETRGERVRVYPSPELRAQVAREFSFGHEWQPAGLPPDYFPLVAGGHDAFIRPGERIIGHGGIAIEEVIVPLVKFEREPRG